MNEIILADFSGRYSVTDTVFMYVDSTVRTNRCLGSLTLIRLSHEILRYARPGGDRSTGSVT